MDCFNGSWGLPDMTVKRSLFVCMLTVCLIAPMAAKADIFSFWYYGDGVTASGTLTVTHQVGNEVSESRE